MSVRPPASFLRLPHQSHLCRVRSVATSGRTATIVGQDASKDIAARRKEIEEANVVPYPQYARSEESISLSSFAEKFEYLERGKAQAIDESTGSGSMLVEGTTVRTCLQLAD